MWFEVDFEHSRLSLPACSFYTSVLIKFTARIYSPSLFFSRSFFLSFSRSLFPSFVWERKQNHSLRSFHGLSNACHASLFFSFFIFSFLFYHFFTPYLAARPFFRFDSFRFVFKRLVSLTREIISIRNRKKKENKNRKKYKKKRKKYWSTS